MLPGSSSKHPKVAQRAGAVEQSGSCVLHMVKVALVRGHAVAHISRLEQPIANAAWACQVRWVSALLAAKTPPGASVFEARRGNCLCSKSRPPKLVASSSLPPRLAPLRQTARRRTPLRRSALIDRERGPSEQVSNGRGAEPGAAEDAPSSARGSQAEPSEPPTAKPSPAERRQRRKAAAAGGKSSGERSRGENRVAADVEWVSDAVSGGLRAKDTFGGNNNGDVSNDVSGGDSEGGNSSGSDSESGGESGGESSTSEGGENLRATAPPQKGGEGWWLKAIRGGLREEDVGGEVVLSEEALQKRVESRRGGGSEEIEAKIREADARVAALKAQRARVRALNPGVLEARLHFARNSVEVTRKGTRGGTREEERSWEETVAGERTRQGRAGEERQGGESDGGRRRSGSGDNGILEVGVSAERTSVSRPGEARTRERVIGNGNLSTGSAKLRGGVFMPDLDKALSSLLRERKLDEAIRLLQDGRARGGLVSRRSYSWLVTLLCRQRRFATAHNWYLSVSQEAGVRLDDTALAMLVQEAVRIERREEAWALLQVMRSYGYCPRVATWSAVVSVFSRHPKTAEQALRIWDEVRSWRFGNQEVYTDTGAYNAALNACISLRDMSRAEALWAQLQAEGLQPNVLTYNIMLRGYALIGEAREMLAGLESMKRDGVRPDVSTYNTRVAGHVTLGDVASAERVLDEVRELAGVRRKSTAVGLEGDGEGAGSKEGVSEERAEGEVGADSQLAAFADWAADKVEPGIADGSAEQTTDSASRSRTGVSYPVTGRNGSFEGVDELQNLDALENQQSERNILAQAPVLEGASSSGLEDRKTERGLLENGQIDATPSATDSSARNGGSTSSEADRVDREGESISGRPEAFNKERRASGRPTPADASGPMGRSSDSPETWTLNGLTAPGSNSKRTERTSDRPIGILNGPEASVSGRPWPTLSELRDEATAGARQRPRRPDAGGSVQTVRPTVRTYTALLRGYVKEGRLREAFELVEEMVAAAGGRQEALPNVVTYTVLIDGCVRKGKVGVARKVVAWMRRQGVAPNTVTYNTLLRGCCRERDMRAGLGVWKEMEEEGVEADVVTYNTMMDLCIKADQVSEAFRWFKRLKESHIAPTVVSYTTAMRGLGLAQEHAFAERLFRTMLDDPSVVLDRPAWNVVIDTFCRAGAMPLAKKVFQAMKTAGVSPDLATYGSLVLGFSRQEDIGEVLVLWKEIKARNAAARESGGSPGRRNGPPREQKAVGTSARGEILVDQRLCDEVLSACVRAGYYERALGVIALMEELGMAINRRKYGELFAEEQERPWRASRTQIIERSPRANDFLEKFKAWLGLDNDYYQREWNWRD